MNSRKYFIQTYGCQANLADSLKISGMLKYFGMHESSDISKCDLLLINTCSVRQKSEDKTYGLGKIITRLPNKPFVVMLGCMAGSALGERPRYSLKFLRDKMPWVDEFVKPSDIGKLQKVLVRNGFLPGTSPSPNSFLSAVKDTGFINISSGCDNFCSYCVVPYARGKEISRLEEDIISEVKKLAESGISKITLCGQNVNSWGLDADEKMKLRTLGEGAVPFSLLLKKISDLENISEISFLSSNPFDFTKDLVETLRLPKISNYIHIAVQSGNNDVLMRMNRRHTVEEYISLIKEIKKVKPKLELGTDIIVGFPGETEEQFMDTVKLFKKIKFNVAFISMYSERLGTFAQKNYEDDIPLNEKRRRHAFLTKAWKETLHA